MPFKKIDAKKELQEAIKKDAKIKKYSEEFFKQFDIIADMNKSTEEANLAEQKILEVYNC